MGGVMRLKQTDWIPYIAFALMLASAVMVADFKYENTFGLSLQNRLAEFDDKISASQLDPSLGREDLIRVTRSELEALRHNALLVSDRGTAGLLILHIVALVLMLASFLIPDGRESRQKPLPRIMALGKRSSDDSNDLQQLAIHQVSAQIEEASLKIRHVLDGFQASSLPNDGSSLSQEETEKLLIEFSSKSKSAAQEIG